MRMVAGEDGGEDGGSNKLRGVGSELVVARVNERPAVTVARQQIHVRMQMAALYMALLGRRPRSRSYTSL